MALVTNTVGYLSAFDGTTLVGGVYKANDLVGNTTIAAVKTYVIPSSAKINYDGTADAAPTPGKASQRIYCPSAGETLFAALVAKMGHYGSLTLTKSAGGTLTCLAILEMLEDVTPYETHGTAEMRILAGFDLITQWDNGV